MIKYFITVLLLVFFFDSTAQNKDSTLSTYSYNLPSEKTHVHFDKDNYLPGETIWFKAYLYNSTETSTSATNFYVAIYDEEGTLIQKKQYPIIAGSCNGDFDLPDTLQSKKIQFRAFTKAMIKEDSNNVYLQTLNIFGNTNKLIYDDFSHLDRINFLPEGGKMIAELENKIGIKAIKSDGSPAMVKGKIMNADLDKRADTFFTNENGMGEITLFPYPNRKYIAVWKDENDSLVKSPLPVNNRYGATLHCISDSGLIVCSIAINKKNDTLATMHLVAQMGNYQIYKANLVIPAEMETYQFKFSTANIPTGIIQISLLDKNRNILQECLIFNKNDVNTISLSIDTISTAPKGKNVFEIVSTDSSIADLSVSITDLQFSNQPNLHSITQDLYFNTQLNGLNFNADSIIKNNNPKDIRLLTLTHSYKRYNWQHAGIKDTVRQKLIDNYITLLPNYKGAKFSLPDNDAINLIVNDAKTGNQFFNIKSTNKTELKKEGLIFYDWAKISYQLEKNKNWANDIIFIKEDDVTSPGKIAAIPDKTAQVAIKVSTPNSSLKPITSVDTGAFNRAKTLKAVVVKTKYKENQELARIDELDKFYTSGMFSGTVKGYQLNVIDDPMAEINYQLQDYMRMRIPGLHWDALRQKFGTNRMIITSDTKPEPLIVFFPALVFINEMEVEEGGDLGLLNMSDVAYVKYISGTVIGAGFTATDGAIYVYTKKGNEKIRSDIKGLPSVKIKGYDMPKEFIVPDFSRNLLTQPFSNTTLYWNPNVILGKSNNHRAKVIFLNNDKCKQFLLKIEGINSQGKLISFQKIIQ